MKKKYVFIEFIVVFFLLILPPLVFVFRQNLAVHLYSGTISLSAIIFKAIVALFLHRQCFRFNAATLSVQYGAESKQKRHFRLLTETLAYSAITYGLLMLVYAAVKCATLFFLQQNQGYAEATVEAHVQNWFLFLLNLIFSAYYEEALYRLFCPSALLILLPRKKTVSLAVECAVIALFALAHGAMGLPSVVNAVLCGIILRLCCIKSRGILCGTIAHFAYNLTMVLLTLAIG